MNTRLTSGTRSHFSMLLALSMNTFHRGSGPCAYQPLSWLLGYPPFHSSWVWQLSKINSGPHTYLRIANTTITRAPGFDIMIQTRSFGKYSILDAQIHESPSVHQLAILRIRSGNVSCLCAASSFSSARNSVTTWLTKKSNGKSGSGSLILRATRMSYQHVVSID